jgi:hypothetical protein
MTISSSPTRSDLDLSAIRLDLEILQTVRERQLRSLPDSPVDMVAVLHRESVERLLTEINAAITRLDGGGYGFCCDCAEPIPANRIELRPWAATCTQCGERRGRSRP